MFLHVFVECHSAILRALLIPASTIQIPYSSIAESFYNSNVIIDTALLYSMLGDRFCYHT